MQAHQPMSSLGYLVETVNADWQLIARKTLFIVYHFVRLESLLDCFGVLDRWVMKQFNG